MELSPVLSMYKRYSKYTTQTHTCRPEAPVDFGQLVEMEIPRYGDFIKTIFVKISLPPTYGVPTSGTKYIYTGSPGLHIFEYIDLVIGDKVIERLDGYSMALYFMKRYGSLYNDVFDDTLGGNPEQHFEYVPPNGLEFHATSTDTSNKFNESFNSNYVNNRNRTIFYPLPFYFFNKSSLAIPICILHKQEIKLRFKFRIWQDLIITDGSTAFQNLIVSGAGKDPDTGDYTSNNVTYTTNFGPLRLVDFSIPVEFSYVSDDDYKYFSSKTCNYIINQTQRQVVEVESNVFNINTLLNFINPVKSIDFFVKYKNNERLYYRNLYNMRANYARIKNGKACMHHIESIQLEFDGETFLSNSIANYQFLNYVQKYKHDLGFYSVTQTDMWQTTLPYITSYSPGNALYTFTKNLFKDQFYNIYAKSVSGPFYSYSFALYPNSEIPCGYMNFSTIRNPYMKINMFSDQQNINNTLLLSEPRQVYIYAYTINILTFDPVKGKASLIFQNPTYT
jgi:hypothetical protein